jgi:hypothetical protein
MRWMRSSILHGSGRKGKKIEGKTKVWRTRTRRLGVVGTAHRRSTKRPSFRCSRAPNGLAASSSSSARNFRRFIQSCRKIQLISNEMYLWVLDNLHHWGTNNDKVQEHVNFREIQTNPTLIPLHYTNS